MTMKAKPTYEELERRVQELEKIESEQRYSKEALRESESLFKMLYEKAPLGYQSLDENGHFIVVNKTWLDTLGYVKEEVIGKSFADFLHPDWRDHFKENFPRFKSIGEILGVEFEMVKKNGDLILVSFTGKISRDKTGNFQQTHCIFHDITERKQTEVALQESKQFMTSLLKAIPLPIFFKDKEGKYIACNDTFTEIMGVTEEDIKGKTVYDLWPTEHAKEYHVKDLELIKSGEHQEYEFVVQDKNGQIRPVIYMKGVFNNTKGEIAGLVGAFLDITERKQTEDALKSNYALLQIAGETVKFGGWSVDLENNICTFSDAVADIHDVPHGYALPVREAINFYAPEWREKITQRFIACAKDGIPFDEEMEIITQKGKRVWARSTGKAVKNEKDKIIKVHGSFQDITEHKQAEAKILYLQKSESLNCMAGAIAHHFNNQLSVVMGNLEIALKDVPLDAGYRKNLFQAMMAGHKAAAVSRQMLIYFGHAIGRYMPIDLSETFRKTLSILTSAIPEGMNLVIDFPVSGPTINADPIQIQQVLTHLITNAWESISNNQGSIGLTIRTVHQVPTTKHFPIDWKPPNVPHACLEVSDTGCGITSMDIEKLFDPFFTTHFIGRGMGLPVVMGIVKAHRGCITVDSEPGRGSTFRIYVPISTEEITLPLDQEKSTRVPTRKVENRGTVLLIEDEKMVRNMAKDMLVRLGYKVIEAQDGVEAVRLFQEHQNEIGCVLSDLTMPRMNGWETLTALREKGADVPVILASGYDKDTVMAGDYPELPQAFLNKPYSMTALKDMLMEVIML